MAASKNSRSIEERIRSLFGNEPLGSPRVVHVAATWRAPDSSLPVIRIGPGSPISETDHFVLRAARMRADTILTTGKILRDEPELRHEELDPEFLAWRCITLARPLPPQTAILTSGLHMDFAHPLLVHDPPPLLVVPRANAARIAAAASALDPPPEVIGRDRPGLRDTLCLLADRGSKSVLVEAGPSTSSELYEKTPAVDELWLSVFEEPSLEAKYLGQPFAGTERLREVFDRTSELVTRAETSGRWTFQRLWRSA